MSIDCSHKQWGCGKTSSVNLQRVGSLVWDIGEPCLHQSPLKVVAAVNKMLKPDKWQAAFDGDGKAFGFQKALKLIVLGGVDPSIRPEVWEFLLGCYALSSTAEYRKKLRTARRERYEELIKQCQKMHSSIGTGSLAFIIGSKVMDMRTYSKEDDKSGPEVERRQASEDTRDRYDDCAENNNCTDTCTFQRESSSDSSDLVSVRQSTDSAAYETSCPVPSPTKYDCSSFNPRRETHESPYTIESFFDFPALPVTNLFDRGDKLEKECEMDDERHSAQHTVSSKNGTMHSFQINNNADLIIEANGSRSDTLRHSVNSEVEIVKSQHHESVLRSDTLKYENAIIQRLRISDVPEIQEIRESTSFGGPTEDRISEWLWTLHRIVVDVVRTDSHLDFYRDPKNLARMSDILAVYAWVDPETGYCQGMSDLLSPFVVLFEDDADAFWCFEMLLRRTRENFRMEGQTGVMKQLQTLWHILELTDREMFAHLAQIGAESLHFAFRMLLVLFRRELTFNEALCMWEMMWAADFNESLAWNLERKCLEPLTVQLSWDSNTDMGEESKENDDGSLKGRSLGKNDVNLKDGVLGNSDGGLKGGSLGKSDGTSKGGSLGKVDGSSKGGSLGKGDGSLKGGSLGQDDGSSKVGSRGKSDGSSKGGSLGKGDGSSKDGSLGKGDDSLKGGSLGKNANAEHSVSGNAGLKSMAHNHSFCGLTRSFWSWNGRMQIRTGVSSTRNGDNELPVFCVAAILVVNRHKIIKDTHSIDDLIKIFNDNLLKIKVKRCIRTAIKLRKKYLYKLTKSPATQCDSPD